MLNKIYALIRLNRLNKIYALIRFKTSDLHTRMRLIKYYADGLTIRPTIGYIYACVR